MISKLQELDLNGEVTRMLRAQGAHEPDWDPLEKVLPYEWCGGFMFMGYEGEIRMYKHGLTRRYINVDPAGNTYLYNGVSESHFPVPLEEAIEHVFEHIEAMGYARETKCTEEVMAERRRRMEEAGWTIVTLGPSEDEPES